MTEIILPNSTPLETEILNIDFDYDFEENVHLFPNILEAVITDNLPSFTKTTRDGKYYYELYDIQIVYNTNKRSLFVRIGTNRFRLANGILRFLHCFYEYNYTTAESLYEKVDLSTGDTLYRGKHWMEGEFTKLLGVKILPFLKENREMDIYFNCMASLLERFNTYKGMRIELMNIFHDRINSYDIVPHHSRFESKDENNFIFRFDRKKVIFDGEVITIYYNNLILKIDTNTAKYFYDYSDTTISLLDAITPLKFIDKRKQKLTRALHHLILAKLYFKNIFGVDGVFQLSEDNNINIMRYNIFYTKCLLRVLDSDSLRLPNSKIINSTFLCGNEDSDIYCIVPEGDKYYAFCREDLECIDTISKKNPYTNMEYRSVNIYGYIEELKRYLGMSKYPKKLLSNVGFYKSEEEAIREYDCWMVSEYNCSHMRTIRDLFYEEDGSEKEDIRNMIMRRLYNRHYIFTTRFKSTNNTFFLDLLNHAMRNRYNIYSCLYDLINE